MQLLPVDERFSTQSVLSVLAQVETTVTTSDSPGSVVRAITNDLGESLPNLLRAIVILVVGWLISLVAAALVKGVLNRINVDNKVANWATGRPRTADSPPIEQWIANAVFWILFIFTIIAFLNALELSAVSQPLSNFLDQVIGYLPELAGAAILLGIAWLVATLVKALATRALKAFGIDERLGQQLNDQPRPQADPAVTPLGTPQGTPLGDPAVPPYDPTNPAATRPLGATGTATPPSNSFSLSETIGNTLYWFVFLLFLPSILSTLRLQGTLQPVQDLLNDILSIIPNILAAVLIGAAGWLVAQVVRRIVTNFLAAAGTDRVGSRFGLAQTSGSRSLSWVIGTIVFVLILIPTAIAALQALQIEAISAPAVNMLNQILNALPQIFTAAAILLVAYYVGQFLSELVTNLLSGLGFNNVFYWLGLRSQPYTPTQTTVPSAQPGQPPAVVPAKTPSEILGIVVWVGTMLFAAIAAINILNIEALTAVVTGITVIFGRILVGLLVFAIGLYLANLAYNLITSSGGRQAKILGQTARIAILALVSAMALQQIGVASDIINLAFGLLLGAVAVAIAIAFGLGGRDVASEQLREWLNSFKQGDRPY